jgi:predicted nucleic acid-binding Zn ribbon protein
MRERRTAKQPERIGNVLAELMAQCGYARQQADQALQDAWQAAAGDLATRFTRVGPLRRGMLEVTVANSVLLQELSFQKQGLLEALAKKLPDHHIRGLRLRTGCVE